MPTRERKDRKRVRIFEGAAEECLRISLCDEFDDDDEIVLYVIISVMAEEVKQIKLSHENFSSRTYSGGKLSFYRDVADGGLRESEIFERLRF